MVSCFSDFCTGYGRDLERVPGRDVGMMRKWYGRHGLQWGALFTWKRQSGG